ncbi:MAG: Uma2 family endonuclease [Betaproteobacteria bacterium]|nr:Uma2 family endonuclease [Betaproteobacteria bacterium]
MGLPQRDDTRHTYAEYRNWPEDVRYELIDGVAYAMAPAPTTTHQELIGGLYRCVVEALDDSPCRVFFAPVDLRLPRADEADDRVDTVVQPDLLVVCDPSKVDERGVRGAPDWVVEVLSPSTASHDHILKRRIYERHGVREYWLIHPTDRVVLMYRLEAGAAGLAYGKPEAAELAGETPVAVLPQVVVDWERVTRRL